MDGLFSHAQPPEPEADGSGAGRPRPITHTVSVPVQPDQAFEGFTEYIHLWWPVGTHSKFGSGTTVAFEAGSLVEEAEDGSQHEWATVVEAKMPERIELSFGLGVEQHPRTRVVLEFREAAPSGSTVTLVHDGWAAGAAGEEQFAKYTDWPDILGYYARFMGASLPS